MTSMWMVQNDEGKFLTRPDKLNYEFTSDREGVAFTQSGAQAMSGVVGGHLVGLVPAKPKVPVSREEAEMLDGITNGTSVSPAEAIADYVSIHSLNKWVQDEDRLIRAYVNGYTVVEPTKYNVKVPHVEDSVYGKMSDGFLAVYDAGSKFDFMQFTMDEIKHYGLEDCEKEEVTDNGE